METNTAKIALGQAKNQALQYLANKYQASNFEGLYKETVRLFYYWNNDLDNEILYSKKIVEEEPLKDIKKFIKTKWMQCPKCQGWIGADWVSHKCGWKI